MSPFAENLGEINHYMFREASLAMGWGWYPGKISYGVANCT